MIKITSSPWIAKQLSTYQDPGHVILWPDHSKGGVHMRRLDYNGHFTQADANLIAAAPELLNAAIQGLFVLHGNPDDATIDAAQKLLEAAIYKAGGEPI